MNMKKELIMGICIIAAIIAGTIFLIPSQQNMTPGIKNDTVEQPSPTLTDQSSEIAGRISHNLTMNPSTSMDGGSKALDKIMIYKTLPPIVDKEGTLTVAKKFNVTGNLRGETTVQSEDLRYYITVTKKSGAVRYQDQNRPNKQTDAPEMLPTDEATEKIATQFLKDRDLYPESAAFSKTYRENAIAVSEKPDRVVFGQIGVWFNRTLNGMNVKGTQLVVYVGGNGDVIGYYANWRDYEPYKEYPLITPLDAFDKLKTKGVPVGMNKPDSLVSIDNVRLAYMTKAGAYSEEYLEPVWVFTGNVMVDGNAVDFVEADIPALTDDAVKSLSSS